MDRVRAPQHEVWPSDEPARHFVGASRPPSVSSQHVRSRVSLHAAARASRGSRRSLTSLEDPGKGVFQGFCRMSWFAGLRCTRFLRLANRQLECFDATLRKRLWAAALDGARVRVSMHGRKIVLSKLPVGVVQFSVADEKSCRQWSAALLRASAMPATVTDDY